MRDIRPSTGAAPLRRRRRRGFSLVEALWTAFLGSALLALILVSASRLQTGFNDLTRTLEGEANLLQAPLLLHRLAAPAGCRRADGLEVMLDGTLAIRADIDGDSGFPDGLLDSSFERVEIRRRDDALQLRSGAGSFQPVLRYVSAFEPEAAGEDRLAVRLAGRISDEAVSRAFHRELEFTFVLHLWNRTESLFRREEVAP